jgi:DNA-binding IclR family transcriptional regulator
MPVGGGALAKLKPGLSPISGGAVARFTNFPEETVRRHLRALVNRGDLVRTKAGYDLNMDNHQLVRRWLDFQTGSKASTRQLVWKMTLGSVIVDRSHSV